MLLQLTDKLSAPLLKVTDAVKGVGLAVNQAAASMQKFGARVNEAGKDFGKIGKDLSMKLTLPIAAIGGAAIKTALDFNKGMANIATLIPGNQKRVAELGDAIIKMSKDTGTSTTDLSTGMYQVVSAFGDTSEAVGQLAAANKAAKAGLSTTEESISLLSAVTKGYGDTTAAAVTKASDLALTTVRLGQTTFPELAGSMGRVVPMAKALNTSQEELFATFATLSGVTGNASEVSSQLKGVFSSMMKPTTDMQMAIQSLGYSGADAMIKQLGLVGSMQKLADTTGGSQEKMAAMFGSVEGLTAALALTGAQAGAFKQKMAEMGKATGATEQAFRDQTTGIGAAGFNMEKLMATIKALAIKIGQTLLPFVERVAAVFATVADIVGNLPGPILDLVLVLAGIVAAVGPILAVVGAFKKLQVVIGALKANPIFLVISGIIALNSLLRGARTTIENVSGATDALDTAMTNVAKNNGMLATLKTTQQGTAEYEQQMQALIAANPKLEKSNINLKSSYEDVANALKGLNEQQIIQAKAKALDEYKAGMNTLGDLSTDLLIAEANLAKQTAGSEGFTEAKIKFDAAKQQFDDMAQTLQNAGQLIGYDQAKVQRDLKKGAVADIGIGSLGSVGIVSQAAQTTLGDMAKPQASDQVAQTLAGIQQTLATPPPDPKLAGSISINVTSDGQATVTGSRFNGGAVDVFMPSVFGGRTRN
jgi:TP901 family phage tail tape measure protein